MEQIKLSDISKRDHWKLLTERPLKSENIYIFSQETNFICVLEDLKVVRNTAFIILAFSFQLFVGCIVIVILSEEVNSFYFNSSKFKLEALNFRKAEKIENSIICSCSSNEHTLLPIPRGKYNKNKLKCRIPLFARTKD